MISAPLANNPLRDRADVVRALRDLWEPIRPRLAEEGASVSLGATQAYYGEPGSSIEVIARPLWGLAALAAGGNDFPGWPLLRQALADGVDPQHPQFWGEAPDLSQYFVEMAALAFGMIMAREQLWDPLERRQRENLLHWMAVINRKPVVDNNWLFFRVLVNMAFERVGGPFDESRLTADLDRLEQFYLGDGWYGDGASGNRDYYVPMGFHFYGLFHARIRGEADPERAERFRRRAEDFAPHFAAWFAPDGSALPFGRSLTYRFTQGAFWGVCAWADLPVLPWGQLKGIFLRHLRWWLAQPIFSDSGLLTIGYRYPNLIVADSYNSPGSTYWACKFFLPLALLENHPFWQAEEEPWAGPGISIQPRVPMVVARDEERGHVFGLSGHNPPPWNPRFGREKYSKFAYSTAFGFGVPVGGSAPEAGGGDSVLLLSEDGVEWRGPGQAEERRVGESGTLYSRWRPWPDVEIETWLAVALPGHVRIHRLVTKRPLRSFEGGFALDRLRQGNAEQEAAGGLALVSNAHGFSGLRDLAGSRQGEIVTPQPNTNLLWPLVFVPGLAGTHEPGEHWLVCAVAGAPGSDQEEPGRSFLADFSWNGSKLSRDGTVIVDCGGGDISRSL
jgi:hypothetical protein